MRSVSFWAVVAVVLAVAAFFAGRELRPRNEQLTFVFDGSAPPYSAAAGIAANSRGGFDGFGAGGSLEGEPVFGGEVVSITDSVLTLRTAAGREQTVRLQSGALVRRIEPVNGALRPGASVIVRAAPDGETAEAVLIVSEP
jgi:hypothetical protein